MKVRWTLLFLLFAARASCAEHAFDVFQKVTLGYVAFCTPSVVDELQLVAAPRWLSPEEARQVAAILATEATWYERKADGSLRGSINFAIPHYDFKFLLSGKEGPTISIRFDSLSRQVVAVVDGVALKLPNMTNSGIEALGTLFELWFPGWKTITYRNMVAWEKRPRPNKAPEPTTTSVTSPAAQEPRQP